MKDSLISKYGRRTPSPRRRGDRRRKSILPGGGSTSVSKSVPLNEVPPWILRLGLEKYLETLTELGVENQEDLEFIDLDSLTAEGVDEHTAEIICSKLSGVSSS